MPIPCPNCDYDLTGIPASGPLRRVTCPECAHETLLAADPAPSRRRLLFLMTRPTWLGLPAIGMGAAFGSFDSLLVLLAPVAWVCMVIHTLRTPARFRATAELYGMPEHHARRCETIAMLINVAAVVAIPILLLAIDR